MASTGLAAHALQVEWCVDGSVVRTAAGVVVAAASTGELAEWIADLHNYALLLRGVAVTVPAVPSAAVRWVGSAHDR